MTVSFKPLGKRVLVERAKDKKFAGQFLVPDSAKELKFWGVVLAIGKEMEGIVAVGDRVLWGKYSGIEVQVDGRDALILESDELHLTWSTEAANEGR